MNVCYFIYPTNVLNTHKKTHLHSPYFLQSPGNITCRFNAGALRPYLFFPFDKKISDYLLTGNNLLTDTPR